MDVDEQFAPADERAAFLALVRERPGGTSGQRIRLEVLAAGGARAAWHRLVPTDLFADAGATTRPEPWRRAAAELAAWSARGLTPLLYVDPGYPARLREVDQAPLLLFADGRVSADDRAVAVVGTRQVSEPGLAFARELAAGLVQDGWTVVSGLAAGVDTAAHEATLRAGGRTVAVLGNGIAAPAYPAANAGLQERIARDGLVLSQFWPDATPRRHTFVQRNATISGYARAVVVVAAGERGGGSLVQARLAVEQGRPLILTDAVVSANAWARALARRRGVQVAATVDDVRSAVTEATGDAHAPAR